MFLFFTKILGAISRSQVDGHVTVPHEKPSSASILPPFHWDRWGIHKKTPSFLMILQKE
ncbi:hypothetical protein BWGOE3_11000 [Bacillus mycoides]|uniref:Uncharacterized protein n=1 Tax=Bacillus mycoides TaxID=1405 RepID=A0A1E8BT32_BACMY|nr:hypothetical protein BWGOE2_10260 [Bacillus mycoides]OFD48905.1 hypothetical protein BWGOE1_10750 [Bacillus mycoides]OFD51017.1 hypothetical protein BWGOE3_11000 [Bacillus mycoides]OFD63195.1 hypothetical protein BWGOE6_11340 [Bacillus mycoides]OFD99202.1 hypothetical protein BWGOE11_10930 [Bacillus mycoides]